MFIMASISTRKPGSAISFFTKKDAGYSMEKIILAVRGSEVELRHLHKTFMAVLVASKSME